MRVQQNSKKTEKEKTIIIIRGRETLSLDWKRIT
jgi:hypothetical protein